MEKSSKAKTEIPCFVQSLLVLTSVVTEFGSKEAFMKSILLIFFSFAVFSFCAASTVLEPKSRLKSMDSIAGEDWSSSCRVSFVVVQMSKFYEAIHFSRISYENINTDHEVFLLCQCGDFEGLKETLEKRKNSTERNMMLFLL